MLCMVHSICFIAMLKLMLNRANVFCGLGVRHHQPRLWKGGDLSSNCCSTPAAPQSGPAASLCCFLSGSCGHKQLPGEGKSSSRSCPRSPQTLTGLVGLQLILPPPHCVPVRLQECNVMESDFWMVWRLLPFVSLNKTRNRVTEKGSRCLFFKGVTQREGPTMSSVSLRVEVWTLLRTTMAKLTQNKVISTGESRVVQVSNGLCSFSQH